MFEAENFLKFLGLKQLFELVVAAALEFHI